MPNKKKRRGPPPRRPPTRNTFPAGQWRRYLAYGLVALGLLVVVLILILRPNATRYGEPWKEFSGQKAFQHVQAIVELGPRPPESEEIKKTRSYIHQQMEANGWQVIDQPFASHTPRGPVQFVNIIARRADQPERGKLFFVGSHYDTKTFDSIRFVGANDGGSSTGALIELGRVLNQHPDLARQIELIFFDGEEAYERFTRNDGLYGSRFFARKAKAAKHAEFYKGGIIWDMIGDRDLTITLPVDSPAALSQGIFDAASALQVRSHFTYSQGDIIDDHTPFNEIGVPTIDLIDFDYPPWHTSGDTLDKLSPDSLQIIGQVTLYFLATKAFR
ncbi:MAG TPA: M28 family peptidase [Chthoniobacterales bacterium]|jgi:Zn-dependent M28 family amino/carboxypeptidase